VAAIPDRSEQFVVPQFVPVQPPPYRPEQQRLTQTEPSLRHQRVLHPLWGVGQVLRTTAAPSTAMVRFTDCVREVPGSALRRVLPVRTLAALIERISDITAWTIRKAHDQGTIQPDAVGRFAGHCVHYYDTARIPALVAQLSNPDKWKIGTLVTHYRYGVGVVRGSETDDRYRQVEFFSQKYVVSASTEDLHRLLPRHIVAKQLGTESRAFRRRAAVHGIYPDYIAAEGRVREYYDESRLDVISSLWNKCSRADAFCPGSIVLNPECGVAKITRRDASGHVQVQPVQSVLPAESGDVVNLQELISLRELARRLKISRYKLQRLLAAVNIEPLHQYGKTQYFDAVKTQRAVEARLDTEGHAVTLRTLAARIGVSERLLGQKVRAACIGALGHHSLHLIASEEAARIQQVLTALRSPADGIEGLRICHLHKRGRTGHEVVGWDLGALVKADQGLSPDREAILFSQVAWMSEGISRTRLRAAFDEYLGSIHATADKSSIQQTAKCLLKLTYSLTKDFSQYRVRLLLLAAGSIPDYCQMEQRIRTVATESGCDDKRTHNRFRSRLAQQLTAVVEDGRDLLASAKPESADDGIRGAVLMVVSDRKPQVGVVTEIEHECWNPMRRCWHETIVVRFPDGERSTRIMTRDALQGISNCAAPPLVLFRNSDAMKLARSLQKGCPSE
jgi:AraC-like DNA-binding protein